ncbi:MAG TPA: thermonuclease family protein [Actinomycetota bacterium]
MMARLLLTALLGASCPLEPEQGPSAGGSSDRATVARVVDGDTVWLEGGEKVRLIGIDAPEVEHPGQPGECFGDRGTEALRRMVLDRRVRVETDVALRDPFDRLLAYLWVGNRMVNETLVEHGFAIARRYPPNLRHAARLEAAQRRARAAGRGLWGTC